MADPTSQPRGFVLKLKEMERRLNLRIDQRAGFDATQLTRTVQKLEELISGLLSQVNGIFSGYVQAAGNITSTAGRGQFAGGVNSVDTYSRLVSYTGYKVQYIASDGWMGYVPSSRRYKRDIKDAHLDIRKIMPLLRVVTFRYKNAVAYDTAEAPTEWGVIAEEIHDLGLHWLVDYDDEGRPEGVKHERFSILLILDAQDKQDQIDALMGRLDRAGIPV